MSNSPLLEVNDLSISIGQKDIVANVSFSIEKGKTLAIVGESGAGKSLIAHSILQLLPENTRYPTGEIKLKGQPMIGQEQAVLESIRGNQVSMIFQEPMTSLNPLHTIDKQIKETLLIHKGITGKPAQDRTIELLDLVGIKDPVSRL